MKFKKTGSKSRGGYTYKLCNGDSVILTPGENDITEADIKRLHALDDAEVYNNIKNSAVPMTERKKIEKAEWDSKHQGESYPKKRRASQAAIKTGLLVKICIGAY